MASHLFVERYAGCDTAFNACCGDATPNLRTKILDFRGSDSSRILISRGGILMSIGDFPESLSQAMVVRTMLVGRLGVSIQCQNITSEGNESMFV